MLLNRRDEATDQLLDYAEQVIGQGKAKVYVNPSPKVTDKQFLV